MTKTEQLTALKRALKSLHLVMHETRPSVFGPEGLAFGYTLHALHKAKHGTECDIGEVWIRGMAAQSPKLFAAWVDKEFSPSRRQDDDRPSERRSQRTKISQGAVEAD